MNSDEEVKRLRLRYLYSFLRDFVTTKIPRSGCSTTQNCASNYPRFCTVGRRRSCTLRSCPRQLVDVILGTCSSSSGRTFDGTYANSAGGLDSLRKRRFLKGS